MLVEFDARLEFMKRGGDIIRKFLILNLQSGHTIAIWLRRRTLNNAYRSRSEAMAMDASEFCEHGISE